MQNFSEGVFADELAGGRFAFPADTVREPFVDVRDIADVVTGLMVGEISAGQVYELTGPQLLTFAAHALGELFTEILDGHNEHLADGVRRALGRESGDLAAYAQATAATGCWAPIPADAEP